MTRVIHLQPHEAWTFARLPDVLADHDIEPRVVTHVGAHHGEEVPIYRQCRFWHIYLCEPDPRSLVVLHDRFDADPLISIIGEAVTPHSWEPVTLHLAERTVWSGVHPHRTATGERVEVPAVPIGELLDITNVLVLDTQGSELDLLRAADLDPLELVIVETTRRPGDGAAFYDDAVGYMHGCGWYAAEEWVHDNSGYTDTVFVPR
jgi:FkbM family methyltransferase